MSSTSLLLRSPRRRQGAVAALLLVAAAAPLAQPSPAVSYELEISLEPASRQLSASGQIAIAPGEATRLLLDAELRVNSLSVDGRPLPSAGEVTRGLRHWPLPASQAPRRVEVEWRGRLQALDASQSHRQTLGAARAVADPRGSFLPSGAFWYPRVAGAMASHRVTLDLPDEQRGLVPGTLLEERERDGRWQGRFEFLPPGDGIDLMAGPYEVRARTLASVDGRGLTVRTWFHPGLEPLADGYLESAAAYLQLYESWLGAYPFDDFGIVSSPTPTGFGMPSLTYLGVQVLRLPFIRHTSLGHEVLHNWWGNGVYVDYAGGNWAEGLTTFMADYHYREQRGAEAAREQRLGWLRDFAAVPAADDRPLASFTSRSHGASQVVGYHKSAMLFLMLRDRLGAERFDRGLRRFWRDNRFAVAGWPELRRAFEAESGRDLADAFTPWLQRPGAPSPAVTSARMLGGRLQLLLEQAAPAWPLRLPLRIGTARGPLTRVVEFDSERHVVSLDLPAPATGVQLDPDFRLFRQLGPGEAPPILRDITLASAPGVLVLDGADRRLVRQLSTRLFEHPAREVEQSEAGEQSALLVVGLHEAIDNWLIEAGLPARPPEVSDANATAGVWVTGDDTGRVIALLSLREASALAPLLRPLPHYGRQSWLRFDGRRAVARGSWPARPPVLRVQSE